MFRVAALIITISLLTISALVAKPPEQDAAGNLTVSQAIELLDGAIQSIRSFNIKADFSRSMQLRVTREPGKNGERGKVIVSKRREGEKPTTSKKTYQQVYQKGKLRIDVISETTGSRSTVFDDEVMKAYKPSAGRAFVDHRSLHYTEAGEGSSYLSAFHDLYGTISMMSILRARKNVTLTENKKSGHVNLEIPPDPKASTFPELLFRVRLDSNHNMLPVAIECEQRGGRNPGLWFRRSVEEWKQLGNLSVPVKLVTRTYDRGNSSPTRGELFSVSTLIVDQSASSWNREISNDRFLLPLPAGTRVSDRTRGTLFVTGKADPGTNLKDLAEKAQYLLGQQDPDLPTESPYSVYLLLSFGAGILLILVASILYIRRRRSPLVPTPPPHTSSDTTKPH